ncbi:hypothetical protein HG536_0A09400 [Torulaspora globosa]|uniref:Actin-binding protein n=1 Tax=Torulaspora globosa TaxID=48254 RepID=A0A7G3ZC87_9SACH|nr:uncharacterized protein HG536_0A09400 [Torulaspora globosa]QLL31123.1 hypothetical protein HG536_0A09400 [Torulaspora globosa]
MALEPIDCTSHSREIEQAYLKVVRGVDADTTWLIISPNEKKEYTPAFVGSAFSEFLETFDDAKVQFGLARVSPPGSDVEKLILIGWCPDSAPMKTRASFAANFGTVANQVLKGYHVQVTARDEDDLDEKELLQKISNAAGARYSIQMNADKPKVTRQPKISSPPPAKESPKPISQSQTKPSAASPVPVRGSDLETDEWNEPEVEERDLNKNPLQASQSTYKPIGRVDLKQVIAEENAKEDPRLVSATEASRKIAPEADIARLKQESKLKRDNEINKFLGTKPPVASSPAQKNDDMVIKGFKNEKSPAQLWAEKKAAASGSSDKAAAALQSEPAEVPDEKLPVEEEEENVHDLKSKFEKLGTLSNEPPIISPRPAASIPSAPVAEKDEPPKFDSKKFGTPLPGMHTETSNEAREESDSDNGDWDDEEPSAPTLPSRNVAQHSTKTEEENQELQTSQESKTFDSEKKSASAEEEPPAPALPARDSGAPAPPPPARRSVQQAKPASPCAIAEYDYEAAEDNELTFSENDKIINIDFVDEDWWLGELEKNGEKGLFPSNYVVLQE